MTKGLVAVVPVRKGSQRVKNKNFKPFAGKNLLIHKIEILKKFVNLKQSKKEKILKLEQMRALENNIKIHVKLTDEAPLGIDTMQDYIDIKKIMSYKS